MVTLHLYRWQLRGVQPRETRDADLGIPLLAPRVHQEIEGLLIDRGYEQENQYRYKRVVDDIPIEGSDAPRKGTLDLLSVPADAIQRAGEIEEGSGKLDMGAIAQAISRPAVQVEVELRRLGGQVLAAQLPLADEKSAVMMKAFAWRSRKDADDAEDMWRTLEIAVAAEVHVDAWRDGKIAKIAEQTIRDAFADPSGDAIVGLSKLRNLSADGTQSLYTRIQALMKRLFG